jgi:hypothetical protein
MLKRVLVLLAAVLMGTYFLSNTPAQNQDDAERPDSWRHLALTAKDQDEAELARRINQLGADGWQMVDVENFVSAGETVKSVYYFKRPG